jgi:hypothetical protein
MTTATQTERFETKAEAVVYLSTNGGIVMVNRVIDRQPSQPLGRLIFTDWYVVDFDVIEAAYAVGMELETDLED